MPSKECGERHNITELSFSTASLSVGISVTTVILNGLMILVFIRNYKSLVKRLFYKIIFNIILADFLNGLIADNLTLSYVIKEGMKDSISKSHVVLSHITFFIFGTVSVVTIGILGIERQWAVLLPFSYRIGIQTRFVVMILIFTWLFAISMSLLYLLVGFYTSLVIFASTTVTLSFIIMVITASVYYFKLIRRPVHVGIENSNGLNLFHRSVATPFIVTNASTAGKDQQVEESTENCAKSPNVATASRKLSKRAVAGNVYYTADKIEQDPVPCSPTVHSSTTRQVENVSKSEPLKRPGIEKSNSQHSRGFATEVEKRATKTFMIILIVYIASYLPTCIMMIYMSTCKQCDCLVLHVLRDVTYLSMVSGCLLRPISFIFSLKPLKNGIKNAFRRHERTPNR